jgi:hypothetical protein
MLLLVNPELECFYATELENKTISNVLDAKEAIQSLMSMEKKPKYSETYSTLRAIVWTEIDEAFQTCTSFQPEQRVSAYEVLEILNGQENKDRTSDQVSGKISCEDKIVCVG